MEKKIGLCYCEKCNDLKKYILKIMPYKKIIRDKEYTFKISRAFCKDCGEELCPAWVLDLNAKEVDEQYRTIENLITLKEIQDLMDLYNIGKTPLALALGFGEVTINRYFNGQVPSKEYSDKMYAALRDVVYFKYLLDKNKEKIGEAAYNKALVAIEGIQKQFSGISGQLLAVIATIFAYSSDITPLALQKLLYYINNIHKAQYGKKVFNDPCEAWVHGPVYRDVYSLFKGFKYNPIDDARIHLLKGCNEHLPKYTKEIIYNVLETFGMYSGKALETITHAEKPWILARDGYLPTEPCSCEISEETLEEYFKEKNAQYNLATADGMRHYIRDMLK